MPNHTCVIPELFTFDEVAEKSKRTTKALRQLRARGRGPRFRNVDGRLLCTAEDLAAWLNGYTAPEND